MDQTYTSLINTLLNMGSAAAPFAAYLLWQNNRIQSRLDSMIDARLAQIKESNEVMSRLTDAVRDLATKIKA